MPEVSQPGLNPSQSSEVELTMQNSRASEHRSEGGGTWSVQEPTGDEAIGLGWGEGLKCYPYTFYEHD